MWSEQRLFIAIGIVTTIYVIAAVYSWFWHIPNNPPHRNNALNWLWRKLAGARYMEIDTPLSREDVSMAINHIKVGRVQTSGHGFHIRMRYDPGWLRPSMPTGSVRGTFAETDTGSTVRVIVGMAPITWLIMVPQVMLAVIFVIAIPFIWGQLFLPQYFGDSLELEGGIGGTLLFTAMFGGYAWLCFFIFYRGWQQRRAVIRELKSLGSASSE